MSRYLYLEDLHNDKSFINVVLYITIIWRKLKTTVVKTLIHVSILILMNGMLQSKEKMNSVRNMLYRKGDIIATSYEPYAFIISSENRARVCEYCFDW